MQRARLLKQVAIAYVTRTVGKWMVDRFEKLQGKIDEAEDLQELAATSAGLKGHCTFLAAQGIEECRKCCGGNGYLLNRCLPLQLLQCLFCSFFHAVLQRNRAVGAGLPVANNGRGRLHRDAGECPRPLLFYACAATTLTAAPQLTTGKFLIKSLRSALAGNQVSGPCEYMRAASNPGFSREKLVSDSKLAQAAALTPDNVHMCCTFVADVALLLLLDAHDDASVAERNGLKGDAVWNRVAVQLVDAVKVG